MKVKLLTSMAGSGRTYEVGDTEEFDDATAQRLIDKGLAEPLTKPGPRKATKKPAEAKSAKKETDE